MIIRLRPARHPAARRRGCWRRLEEGARLRGASVLGLRDCGARPLPAAGSAATHGRRIAASDRCTAPRGSAGRPAVSLNCAVGFAVAHAGPAQWAGRYGMCFVNSEIARATRRTSRNVTA